MESGRKKKLTDFKNEDGSPLFTEEELKFTVMVDDNFHVIADRGRKSFSFIVVLEHLIQSKKFL